MFAEVQSMNSPQLGSHLTETVRVTSDLANGVVGFSDLSTRYVTEPHSASTQVLENLRSCVPLYGIGKFHSESTY